MAEAVNRWLLLLSSAALLCSIACKPEIGDECTLSTDCSATGERLCDTTQPGGYCTIFNCEPGSCPEEAICVGFNSAPSSNPECADALGSSRFYRAFCMFRCDGDDDCRDGYDCIDMNHAGRDTLGAVVIERPPVNGKVCAVRPKSDSEEDPEPLPAENVCRGSSGSGGSGGQAGSPGSGGQGGAGTGGAGTGGASGASGSAGASGGGGSAGSAGAGGA